MTLVVLCWSSGAERVQDAADKQTRSVTHAHEGWQLAGTQYYQVTPAGDIDRSRDRTLLLRTDA